MKNIFALIILCLFFQQNVSAQTNKMRDSILNYQNTNKEIITKGRNLLRDKFLAKDKQKVKEILEYLDEIEEKNEYVAFNPNERWLICYFTGDYEKIIRTTMQYDSAFAAKYFLKIHPSADLLLLKLKENLRIERQKIKNDIDKTYLSKSDKDFLTMNFDFLLNGYGVEIISQDSLNLAAEKYFLSKPNTYLEAYTRENIRDAYRPANWGLGIEFFSGLGAFTGDLSNSFKLNVPIGVAFDLNYKNYVLFLRDYIGFGSTRDAILFNEGKWRKSELYTIILPEASIGYIIKDTEKYKIVPFIGIASTNISPPQNKLDQFPEYENIELSFTTTYTVGVSVDLKLFKPREFRETSNEKLSYGGLRLRYAYNQPQFERKYDRFGGGFHYLTVGLIFFGKKMVKD